MSEKEYEILELRADQLKERQEEMNKTFSDNICSIYEKIDKIKDEMIQSIEKMNNKILGFFTTILGAIVVSAIIYIITNITK